MSDWKTLLTLVLAMLGLLFGLYRWIVHRADKRHAAHEKRFKEHATRFDRHESRIEKNEGEVRRTRDDLQTHYVRIDQMERFRSEISANIDRVHHRLGGLAKDLNQAIGTIEANRDADMRELVKEIKDAIKQH